MGVTAVGQQAPPGDRAARNLGRRRLGEKVFTPRRFSAGGPNVIGSKSLSSLAKPHLPGKLPNGVAPVNQFALPEPPSAGQIAPTSARGGRVNGCVFHFHTGQARRRGWPPWRSGAMRLPVAVAGREPGFGRSTPQCARGPMPAQTVSIPSLGPSQQVAANGRSHLGVRTQRRR